MNRRSTRAGEVLAKHKISSKFTPKLEIDGTLPENLHFKWSPTIKPVAFVESGDVLRFKIPDASTMQLTEDSTSEDFARLDMSKVDAAVGPVWIADAEKGDVLEIELLELNLGNWGWSGTYKDSGIIKGRFRDDIAIWSLRNGIAECRSQLLHGLRLPLKPFLGIMGLSPEEGDLPMIPPHRSGGNLDNKLLTAGSKLYLPIQTEGALFSVADPHAIQGDGEVGATAIETQADATLRLNVIKGKSIEFPRARSRQGTQGLIVTMGIAHDLYLAAAYAEDGMIDELSTFGYTVPQAYMLTSLIGDLKISEIVDDPNYVVSMTVPIEMVSRKRQTR